MAKKMTRQQHRLMKYIQLYQDSPDASVTYFQLDANDTRVARRLFRLGWIFEIANDHGRVGLRLMPDGEAALSAAAPRSERADDDGTERER